MALDGPWPPSPEALPHAVVDNHTHLEFPVGDVELTVEQRLTEASAVGVDRVVQIGCDVDAARWTAKAVTEYPSMLGGVALHPNNAARLKSGDEISAAGDYHASFAEIAALARGERIRVIGETGLDFFRTAEDGREGQIEAFRDHIALAKELNLPMQIHDRDAHAEVIATLDRDGAPEQTIFHCFSGDAGMAKLCAQRGWFLSFSGTVTFKNAQSLRAALSVTPLEQVLVETDAPFLTPHPHRGAPNAPYLVPHTMRMIADVKEVLLQQACEQISATSESLYGPW